MIDMTVKGDDSDLKPVSQSTEQPAEIKVVTPEVVEPETIDAAKPKWTRARWKINHLPPDIKRQLDERIDSGAFGTYRQLSKWLLNLYPPTPISGSALQYYVKYKRAPELWAVKMATHQAVEIVKAAGGLDDEMNHALTRLIQTVMFELLVEMNKARRLLSLLDAAHHHGTAKIANKQKKAAEAGEVQTPSLFDDEGRPLPRYPSHAEVAVVAAFGRVTAILGKQTLDWTKWRHHLTEGLEKQIDKAQRQLKVAVQEGGLSIAAEKQIRNALMEIKV